ncbi:hypothetical protein HDV03_000348 [Kappamyces sp. JEL0829]|nr:hypothetical protein HDV03_000348 [Kappamyces sp. JEL0829]KAJ3373234.1 hypothetical protein HDU91_000947 [Kappamyces sp. JEL0680]
MASSDLIWLIVRNNSSFLVKRNGIQLSREPGNLLNKQSFKSSGLTNKVVTITPAEKGVKVTVNTPKGKKTTTLTGNVRQSARTVKTLVTDAGRPDLVSAALARVSRIIASQGPAKAVRAKKIRSARK